MGESVAETGQEGHRRPVTLVANLGLGQPPTGQTIKARALLDLLDRSGRRLEVIDVGRGRARVLGMLPSILRGRTVVVVLNRKGLWAALAVAWLGRLATWRRSVVLVPVVGGWLPDHLRRPLRRRLARVVDEFLAETPQLVTELRGFGLPVREFVNFRRLPVDGARARRSAGAPLRLCFAGRLRADKGLLVAAQLAVRLEADGLACELDVYGPVEDEVTFREAMGVAGVTYRGTYASPDEALEILSGYDFLVLPSRYVGECMPGVVVEACFAGLPAVVSDWKDLGQVVVDGVTGYVCPLDRFVDVAATRIAACVRDGQLPALSRNALEQAARCYTEESARRLLMARITRRERAA